jgi:multidrug efflux pump subunit AcrB
MEEVSGPVVAIALILAAVLVPTIFISGITGRLYQQFAITIALSVALSAFNALSLSPALAALLLRPRKQSRGKPELQASAIRARLNRGLSQLPEAVAFSFPPPRPFLESVPRADSRSSWRIAPAVRISGF